MIDVVGCFIAPTVFLVVERTVSITSSTKYKLGYKKNKWSYGSNSYINEKIIKFLVRRCVICQMAIDFDEIWAKTFSTGLRKKVFVRQQEIR